MSVHRALALKWRPAKFADVVGQPHVVKTLSNALETGKIAHAYLFTGPRGVGKTTCARILARAANCERGMSAEPCGECPMCKDSLIGRALDVIEIDAASSRGIDEIRDLREVVRLAPARGRKKVFILDEAHMLTGAAANAFLKTLEEPPDHVLFVLATTNASDILPTIHSRCQRFDFHPLGLSTIIAALKKIAAAEKIKVDDEALALIARAARGAMRDGQMLLEQSAAFAPEGVTAPAIRELLGLVEAEWVERFLAVLRDRDVKAGLGLLDELLEAGRGLEELLNEVQEELRDALMHKLGAGVTPVAAAGILAAPERTEWFTEEELTALLAHVRRAVEEVSSRSLGHPRIGAELALARLLRRERALSWAEVEDALARVGSSATPASGVTGFAGVPAAAPGPRAAEPAGGGFVVKPPAGGGPPPRPLSGSPGSAAPAGWSPARPAPVGAPPSGDSIPASSMAKRWPEVLDRLRGTDPVVHGYLKGARCASSADGVVHFETASPFHRQGLETGEMKSSVESALSAIAGTPVSITIRSPGEASPAIAAPARPAAPASRPVMPAPAQTALPAKSLPSNPRPAPPPAAQVGGTAPAVASPPPASGAPSGRSAETASPSADWVDREPMVKAALDVFKGRLLDVKRPNQK